MKLTLRTRESFTAYTFLTANLIGFLIFMLLPVLFSLVISFFNWQILDKSAPPTYVEFANYKQLLGFSFSIQQNKLIVAFNDIRFWHFLWNTLFLMIGIPIGMAVSLFLAVVMNQKLRGILAYRTVFFLPAVTAGVALYLLWAWVYNEQYGLLNIILAKTGMIEWMKSVGILSKARAGVPWLTSAAMAKPAFILMGLWIGAGGYNMILYLAALQGVDPELYEAAEIDGANAWKRFWTITWPMISPTTFFIVIMSVIYGIQGGFQAAYMMTQGGPEESTTTLSYYVFQTGFKYTQMGYASAIAWVIFVIIIAVTLINWRFGGRVVHYE